MEHLLQLYQQLRSLDELINGFASYSGMSATLENMYRTRRNIIKKIVRHQIRNFNRG